jgi:hypothetical protein
MVFYINPAHYIFLWIKFYFNSTPFIPLYKAYGSTSVELNSVTEIKQFAKIK